MGELSNYKVGQVVELGDGKRGTIRWLGTAEFAEGEWIGLELDKPEGKNNGLVKGVQYFSVADNHGLMIKPNAITTILQQPAAAVSKAAIPASKRTSILGAPSNGTKTTAPAAKRLSTAAAAPGLRRQTLVDPTSKRQSINAGSPTPAARGAPARGLPSPTKPSTKPTGGRPPSISGPPKSAVSATRPPPTSTAAKRMSIAGRPSLTGGPSAARAGRATSVTTAGSATRSTVAPPGVKPANRLSTLQQPASRRTASISSRAEMSETGSLGQEDDDDQPSEQDTDAATDVPTRKVANAGRAMLSPPTSAREPTSPHLSRPTTQQLSAQNRKIDDLETKLRVLEKQKAEDKERLKELERLSTEKEKLSSICEKLQGKIQPLSQENAQLKKDLKEMEERATTAEGAQASVDEVIEEAALDREMAEELAETYKTELEMIRKGHEELKLEVEILRAENEDLGREMSPEERDSMGFAQLEKSNERLRDALIRLRDITQDTEAELKDQIKDLQDETQELSTLKTKFEETQEQLGHSEALVEELRQQLETAQGGEEMIEELTEKNLTLTEEIEQLKSAVEDLESLKEINDELELNHVEHEKAMQEDIDYRDALLFEQARKMSEQDEVVEELEYTVSRFRELVANLNSDLEDMKASQQITEAEANDLSTRSKAMLDLNMRLQQTAAKTQIKVIDTELKRLEAQEAVDQLAIVQMFLPESYSQHRDSVTAFLRFKRVSFKATMLHGFIKEKVSGLAIPGHEEDMFFSCESLDKLTWISAMCNRFVKFIISCPLEIFSQIGNASYDLDPVERTFNGFVENLRKDELKDRQCSADLSRTMSVLEHLGERYLGEGLADFAEAVRMRALVMQSRLDTGASAITHIRSIAQARVVLPSDADELDEDKAQDFLNRADNVISQIRSAKVIAGKALHQLEELQSRSLTLEPSTHASIEATELAVSNLASACRSSGVAVARLVNEEMRFDSLTFEDVMRAVTSGDVTPFASLASNTSSAISAIQSFSSLTTTLSQTVEFTAPQSADLTDTSTPWAQLAVHLREESSASVDHEAEIARLHDQLNERSTGLAIKDKQLSELRVSVEVLEKRTSDANKAVNRARELEQLLHQAERKHRDVDSRLSRAIEDVRLLRMERETWLASGAAKAGSQDAGDRGQEGVNVNVHPDFIPAKAVSEIAALKAELEATQMVVRQLRTAASEAQMSAAQSSGILESLIMEPKVSPEEEDASLRETSAKNAFKMLRGLVSREDASFVKLANNSRDERLKWKPAKETAAWQVGRRKDEWTSWRDLVDTVAKDELEAARRSKNVESARQERKQRQAVEGRGQSRGEVLAKLALHSGRKPALPNQITIVHPGEWDALSRRIDMSY